MISIVRQRLLNSLKNKNRSFISKRMKSTSTTTTTNGEPAAEKTPDELANDLQKDAFKNENCFLVNESDQIIGNASKAECHKVRPDGTILLHRAFSVFMFNSDGHLLLQKRSPFKITYPEHYTNTCCSHPIANIPGEDEELNALGIRRAAQRRLSHEMGIAPDLIPLDDFKYITRVHYMDTTSGKWGEHEIDYILFVQSDAAVKPNSDEICEISYVPRAEIDHYLPKLEAPLTPWFNLILKYRLKLWWDNLENIDEFVDHSKITHLLQSQQ